MEEKLIDQIDFSNDVALCFKKVRCSSYEEFMAIASQYLHNSCVDFSNDEIVATIADCIQNFKNSERAENFSSNIVAESELQYGLFKDFFNVPFPCPKVHKFTFIDLFAGIGGFRIAMQNTGGKCVFSSEWDKFALYRGRGSSADGKH